MSMLQNAAMNGGAENHRAAAASLSIVALVAVAILVLALAVHGNERGTIVVQQVAFSGMTSQHGTTQAASHFSATTINQTAPDGVQLRTFSGASSHALETVSMGDTVETYEPRDNTIYMTTFAALQRALEIQSVPPGTKDVHIGTSRTDYSIPLELVPGRASTYAKQLLAGRLHRAGRTTIDGRPAIKLVATYRLSPPHQRSRYVSRQFVYVTPGTYDPIEAVVQSSFGALSVTEVERWSVYRVLTATPRTERLVSLTARHPGARIVHSPSAYLHAGQMQFNTSNGPSGSSTSVTAVSNG